MTPALADRGQNVCPTFMLLPHLPFHVHRVLVTDCEFKKNRQPIGVIYRFLANLTDVATIPRLDVTNVIIGGPTTRSEPWIWRAAAENPAVCVSVEETSDAGATSLEAEARKAWQSMAEEFQRRGHWMSLIGLHEDIVMRAAEPFHLRAIEIRTMHDDMLARMFATGSAEIARVASMLHSIEEKQQDREPEFKTTLQRFMWPVVDELPDWAQKRYDEALAGGYTVLQSRFAPQEEMSE
jgi:hypothetical protein